MSKKDLTVAASTAATKFFSSQPEELSDSPADTAQTDNTNNEYNIKHINNTKYNNISNKSKHYDERGKREVRHGLLLDKKLKEDLTLLCYATGNRSINDYIVSLLIEHTEQPENQRLLKEYSNLNKNK